MTNGSPRSIDMSLRLYSEGVPLDPIVHRLGLAVSHLHVREKPIADVGPLAGRLAKRHYASIGCTKGGSIAEMHDWLGAMEGNVEADAELVRLLRRQEVEAVFWIAVFGDPPVATPEPTSDLCDAIATLPASVLVENYACDGADTPSKTWFPPRSEAV